MCKLTTVLAIIALSVLVKATSGYADTVGPVVLTPNGSNTNFKLTGVFNGSTPTTGYSGPNEPWTLTFTLETTPTSEAFVFPDPGLFGIDTTVDLNGVDFPDTQVLLFGLATQGGITICLSSDCTPGFPPAPSFFDIFTVDNGDNYTQLFTGDVSAPTFFTGSFPVDGSQSSIAIAATPEPSSLALLGTGLLALGASTRKRFATR
jgi:PEP-CTERM motif-containing protein